jgi:hypothetical protein
VSYAFLSPEWIAAFQKICGKFAEAIPLMTRGLDLNLVVINASWKEPIQVSLKNRNGELYLSPGHLPNADLHVTIPSDRLKHLWLTWDFSSIADGILTGEVKLMGDIRKAWGTAAEVPSDLRNDPTLQQFLREVADITA